MSEPTGPWPPQQLPGSVVEYDEPQRFSWARNLDKALGQIGYATLVAVAANPDFIPQALALIPAGVRPLVGIVLSATIVSFLNWSKHRSK